MEGVGRIATTYGTQRTQPRLDRNVAELAAAQHGVISLAQLRRLGLSSSGTRSRVAAGRLHSLHRGVYAVGYARVTGDGHRLAAVLACEPDALLACRSAAALLDLRRDGRQTVDVMAPGRRGRRRPGIEVHRSDTLHPDDITAIRGIPCTSVARTLLDCADTLDRRQLERMIEQAEIQRTFDRRRLVAVLDRARGRRGAAVLRDLVDKGRGEPAGTRSELERRFLDLCNAAGVERPSVNVRVEGFEVDFSWPAQRLLVETDGYSTHGTATAFERDRERDRLLLLAGWRVARFTWRQVTRRPAEVKAALRALLRS